MDDKKKKPGTPFFLIFAALLLVAAILPVILPSITSSLSPYSSYTESFIRGLQKTLGILVGLSFPFSLFCIIMIIYCTEQLKRMRRKEKEMFEAKVEPAYESLQTTGNEDMARRWGTVVKHIESESPNDWKQAILEADIMLDDLLTNMGYRGESIGEKLKRVDPAHFETLNDAWEAHKIRNDIAHQSQYSLNQIDARRVIQQYRKVFEEFYYI